MFVDSCLPRAWKMNGLRDRKYFKYLAPQSLDMASQTSKVRAKLASLNTSLSELESLLEPLLAQSLPESTLELEPLQQAKLQTVLPYVVYDLVFSEFVVTAQGVEYSRSAVYLKTKGVDPKTHPVVSELVNPP